MDKAHWFGDLPNVCIHCGYVGVVGSGSHVQRGTGGETHEKQLRIQMFNGLLKGPLTLMGMLIYVSRANFLKRIELSRDISRRSKISLKGVIILSIHLTNFT